MILDTHLHLIDKSVLSYPWLSAAPALDRDFSYAEYARQAHRTGIGATLHMEVDVGVADMEAETAYVGDLARQPGSLLRGAIAACRPEDAGFAAYLDRQRRNPFVLGFRRVLHSMADDLSDGAIFRDNIRRLAGTGLTYDLIFQAHNLPRAAALADAAPGVQFVLDHCGSPDIKGGDGQPWWENIRQLSRRPNVVAKVSGIIAYTDPEGWTVESLRPFVEHTIACFGWDRVVWGSDWPVCNLGGGLAAWVAATHSLIAGTSRQEREALLSGNARRLWNLS